MEHIISVVLKELKFGSIKDEMWLSKAGKHHETYNFRSAGERIRRPEPGGGPLLPARLQHRDPDGGPTEDPTLSRMTIVTMGDERVLEQIQKQLHKLVDVLKVCDLSEGEHIEREIALVKARAAGGGRDELKRLADIFRGQIVDVTPELYTVQLVGTSDKLDAFIKTYPDQRDYRSGALRCLRYLPCRQGAAPLSRWLAGLLSKGALRAPFSWAQGGAGEWAGSVIFFQMIGKLSTKAVEKSVD